MIKNDQNEYLSNIIFSNGQLKKEFSVLFNGKNIHGSLSNFDTLLNHGDELIITVQITGG